MKWILQKLSEKTTWLGLLSIASGLGLKLTEGTTQAIAAAGIAIAGLILVFMNEKK